VGLFQYEIHGAFIQTVFGIPMKKVLSGLILLSFPIIMPAQADHFPLNVGNSWNYQYGAYEWDQLGDVIKKDTGKVQYSVIKRDIAVDSTLWYLNQIRSISRRHLRFYLVPPHDTTYTITDTVQFLIVEYSSALHRIHTRIWDWRSVYHLGNQYPDSIQVNRFNDGALDTLTVTYQVKHYQNYIWPKIIVSSVGSIGIIRLNYSEPDYSLYVRRVTAVLTDAMITGIHLQTPRISVPLDLKVVNFPNPFNPATTIKVIVPHAGKMVIRVYDAIGREVGELYNGAIDAGEYRSEWYSGALPSGMYICRVTLDGQRQSQKMFLIR
jgi:hypothetical protein